MMRNAIKLSTTRALSKETGKSEIENIFLSGKRTAGFPLSRTQNCTLLENEGWTRSNRTERILNRPSRQQIPSTGDFFGSPLSGQTGAVPSEEGRGIHTPENLGESVARDLKAYFFFFCRQGNSIMIGMWVTSKMKCFGVAVRRL